MSSSTSSRLHSSRHDSAWSKRTLFSFGDNKCSDDADAALCISPNRKAASEVEEEEEEEEERHEEGETSRRTMPRPEYRPSRTRTDLPSQVCGRRSKGGTTACDTGSDYER
jgi:hypothetical protein